MGRVAHFAKLGFLTVLIAIQCLGPLLHAHMGTPLQNGFHLDLPAWGLTRVLKDEASSAKDLSLRQHEDEPFSVEVEKGVKRAKPVLNIDPALIDSLLALCAAVLVLMTAAVSRRLPRRFTRHRQCWRGGGSRPPPAQAPPLTS